MRREVVAGLYEAHGRSLLAYARSFCRDVSAAEDIVHAVFVKLLDGSGSVPEALRPYLMRAVRNTSLNARRQTIREVDLTAAENWLEAPAGMEDEAMALQTALDTQPEPLRHGAQMLDQAETEGELVPTGDVQAHQLRVPSVGFAQERLLHRPPLFELGLVGRFLPGSPFLRIRSDGFAPQRTSTRPPFLALGPTAGSPCKSLRSDGGYSTRWTVALSPGAVASGASHVTSGASSDSASAT